MPTKDPASGRPPVVASIAGRGVEGGGVEAGVWYAPEGREPAGPPLTPGRIAYCRLAVVASLAAFSILSYFVFEWFGIAFVFTGLIWLVAMAAHFGWLSDTSKLATKHDLTFLDLPSDRGVTLVRMEIVQEGVVTGEDRGAVWFQEDALVFVGHRCSFLVGGQDVPATRKPNWLRRPDTLPLVNPIRPTGIRFDVLRMKDSTWQARAWQAQVWQFTHRLSLFVRDRPAYAGRRQYPPLTLSPTLPLPSYGEQLALAVAVVLIDLLLGHRVLDIVLHTGLNGSRGFVVGVVAALQLGLAPLYRVLSLRRYRRRLKRAS